MSPNIVEHDVYDVMTCERNFTGVIMQMTLVCSMA